MRSDRFQTYVQMHSNGQMRSYNNLGTWEKFVVTELENGNFGLYNHAHKRFVRFSKNSGCMDVSGHWKAGSTLSKYWKYEQFKAVLIR